MRSSQIVLSTRKMVHETYYTFFLLARGNLTFTRRRSSYSWKQQLGALTKLSAREAGCLVKLRKSQKVREQLFLVEILSTSSCMQMTKKKNQALSLYLKYIVLQSLQKELF